MSKEKPAFNIHRPPHLVANELIRAIEGYLWQDGIGVQFGEQGHAMIEKFVDLYNREIERYYDEANMNYFKYQEQTKKRLAAETNVATLRKLVEEMSDVLLRDNPLAHTLSPRISHLLNRADAATVEIKITGEES